MFCLPSICFYPLKITFQEKLVQQIQSLHIENSKLKERSKAEIEAKDLELNETKSHLANSNESLTKFEKENKDLTKNLSLAMQEKVEMGKELHEKV